MIKTHKSNNWDIPVEVAIQQCADSRLGKYYGPYFWIIEDSIIPGKKHMAATEITSEAVDCNQCEHKGECKYGQTLNGPMITIEEMVANRSGKDIKNLQKEIDFFHQVKNTDVHKIENICKTFNRDCSQCPMAIHKPNQYHNNHLCITGMNFYTFLHELDVIGSKINFK